MTKHTVVELRKICKEKGIKGYSKLKKSELIKLCLTPSKPKTPTPKPKTPTPKSKTPTSKPKITSSQIKRRKEKRERVEIARKKRAIRKQQIKKAREMRKKEKELEKKERAERHMETPERMDRTSLMLDRITSFVREMNSTNKRRPEILKKYFDLKEFISFVLDEDQEFGITSDDYRKFVKTGKKKKIRNPYVDFMELLVELDDYKKEKALLHLYNFIQVFPQYENLILTIIDKQIPIHEKVTSIKLEDSTEKKENLEDDVKDTKKLLFEIERLVSKINKTNKTNRKKEILAEFKHLKQIIKYIYDPDISFGIKSKYYLKYEQNDKKIKRELLGKYTELIPLLDDLSERKITGETASLSLYHFIQLYPMYKQTILNIIDKSLKIRMNKTVINEVFEGLFSSFEPALANKYDKKIIAKAKGTDWFLSRKLDGVRCLILVNTKDKKVSCFSRTGKKIETLKVLEDSILNFIDDFDGSYMLDGEIIHEQAGKENFKLLMEEIRRKDFTIENPSYRMFDIIRIEEFYNTKKSPIFSDRYQKMIQLFGKGRVPNVRVLAQHVYTPEIFEKLKKQAAKKGWEGLMFRKDVPFRTGRSNDLLKYKAFYDDEYVVVGIEEGYKDMLNKLTKQMEPTKIMSAVFINYNNVKVGSGFSDMERVYYLENPDKIIGKTITVQYFEKTEKSLRFPTFKFLHGDKREL
jgi:DNA ligase-1